jgi:catechol 2,3-dioxygenase-like lactoylglutathione lyase family enzyme
MHAHLILYVQDQQLSKSFYQRVLGMEPSLHVDGMTEFSLSDSCIVGLMPISSIKRLLGQRLPDPSTGTGIPRAELYLRVENASAYHSRALANGAIELSGLKARDWGHSVAYSLDPDGHVLAFAEPPSETVG